MNMDIRVKQVALGFAFWFVFVIPGVLCLILQPVGIAVYALGNDNIRAWIYRTGKALDQFNNAAWFGGNPKETISSHTGRWYQAEHRTNGAVPLAIPLRFQFVKWLTDLFEIDHVLKAIEEPFNDEPL